MFRRTLSLATCLTLSLAACDQDEPRPGVIDQDTTIANEGFAAGWTDCWQSFTAGMTGSLTAVRVWAFLPSNVTLTLYEGEGTSGRALGTTTSLVHEDDDRWHAEFSSIAVTAGRIYTVQLTAASDLNWIVGTYAYAGGVNNVYGADADFGLTTYVREARGYVPSGRR